VEVSNSTQALALALGAGLVGAVLAPFAARRGASRVRRGVETLVLPTVAAMTFWVLGLALLTAVVGVTSFESMSFVYLAAVIAAPLVMLGVLVAERWSTSAAPVPTLTRPAHVLAVALVLLAPLGLYASRVEPRRLEVAHHTVALAGDVAGRDAVRVGVIADIQTIGVGPYERRAVRELLAERPDVVLIAGDLFQGTPSQWTQSQDAYRALLRDLDQVPAGAFVVGGDVDGNAVPYIVEGTGVTYLRSEVTELAVGDRRLRVLGVPLEPDDESEAALQAFADAPRTGEARILLAHRPDWAQRFGRGAAGVDLVVAGHTHGGQIQVPVLGPLITMSGVPRTVAAGGLHVLDGQPLYVSTGVGMEQQGAPQIRLGARPSVAILTLR
jgi:predicted MPP superfamily phosphohydrolase